MISDKDLQAILSARKTKTLRQRFMAALPILSVMVILTVFWCLRLRGITLAGDAFCGMEEHIHSDTCGACTIPEHIHKPSCYSNLDADLEGPSDWEATLKGVPEERASARKILAVAQSQLGYTESSLNFQMDDQNQRRGYTRYGEWYGNPYGGWNTMFTSFCLRYGGFEEVPISGGAESLRIQWQTAGLFNKAGAYLPVAGDVLFWDENQDGSADITGIISEITAEHITLIQGDVEGQVAQCSYPADSNQILGFGVADKDTILTVVNQTKLRSARLSYDSTQILARTVNYSANMLTNGSTFVLYTQGSDGNHYAIDGNGNAVPITIDSSGNISGNSSSLFWRFEYCGTYDNRTSYYIQNTATGMYLHPFVNSNTDQGAILSGRWESALYQNGTGVRVRGARQNAYAVLQNNSRFVAAGNLNSGSTLYFGQALPQRAVWLDGTNGGLMAFGGSPNTAYFVNDGSTVRLPTQWQSPNKYGYKLQGWYDVKNSRYYAPGAEVRITEDMVFYADWVAETYDIGQLNEHVSNTVDTSKFVTTDVFDYNILFNAQSLRPSVSVDASGHTETWNLVTSGRVPYKNGTTLDYLFRDYDQHRIDMTWPNNCNDRNTTGGVYSGLYYDELGQILFGTDNAFDPATGTGIIGKTYLGRGEQLFSFMSDESDPHYGYYYYDSTLNAASYNQSEQRFYVYDYLARTSDSARTDGTRKYSDFMPLNSPYANTNGKTLPTYTYDGVKGEYGGTTHYAYDSKYNTEGSTTSNVGSNFFFGMAINIDFFLPDVPGTRHAAGHYGNHDTYGNEMHFQFTGDDDVWVLLDGKLVLDIGGIHGVESGDINFSTGAITVNGTQVGTLGGVQEGEHILTIYYLERGSSQSNCSIYFNLAPRFQFEIKKEDVLTREVLNGAEFSVFMDEDCTQPAPLWSSREAYENGEASTHVFCVEDGVARMWGMTSGRMYYIKETRAPDKEGYSLAHGVICLTLDHQGFASYTVDIHPDESGGISPGFTVHGLKVDVEKQEAYVVITNAEDWVRDVTTVSVSKKWNDSQSHSNDFPIFYLLVKDSNGTYRRIREITLNDDNGWQYAWTNLPKYYVDAQGNQAEPIEYLVEEAFYSGYTATVERIEQTLSGDSSWMEAYQFENGETYVLKTPRGCLSTALGYLAFVDENTAKTSPQALWVATVNADGTVRFTNQNGQMLQLSYRGGNITDCVFTVSTEDTSHTLMKFSQTGNGVKIYHDFGESWNNTRYYIGSGVYQYNGVQANTEGNALIFTPLVERAEQIVASDGSFVYRVTNTPIPQSNQTSVTVRKTWDVGVLTTDYYLSWQIPVTLYANGKDTGLTDVLTLQNGWTARFTGLPYRDADGNIITYSVQEQWNHPGWEIVYGSMQFSPGNPGSYTTTIVNRNLAGFGVEMPATGAYGPTPWILCGLALMLSSLVLGFILWRRRERGSVH